jgi:transposase
MAKYIVRLTPEERTQLTALISTGRWAASVLTRARMLLKADASEEGPDWSDREIAEAVETSLASVHRVRQVFVKEGLAAALERQRPTGRQYRKLDGAQEARLVALTCSAPPEGRARWTLQLLADRLVELEVVDTIGRECVRTTLKKMTSSRGRRSSG